MSGLDTRVRAEDAPIVPRSWREREGAAPRRLAGSIAVSAVLHVLVIAGFVLNRAAPRPPAPPIYRVDLVAAPPGPPAIGAVAAEPPPAGEPAPAPAAPAPTPTPPKAVEKPAPVPTPAPPRPATPPKAMPLPTPTKTKPAPPVATPVPPSKTAPTPPTAKPTPMPAKPAPTKPTAVPPAKSAATTVKPTSPSKTAPAASTKAGEPTGKPGATGPTGPRAAGGETGGRGADVANVHIAGLEFAYPGYLQNIVRQVRLRFSPDRGKALQADVAFLIHRDGSVSDIRIVRKSGDYAFDLEARGAIEASGQTRAFGALPDGFKDDVLPVTFSFDPSVIR